MTRVATRKSWVYFLARGGEVKIGTSIDVRARVATLGGGELLGMEPGDRQREGELHHQFQESRTTGEWFTGDAALLAYVKALPPENLTGYVSGRRTKTVVDPEFVRRAKVVSAAYDKAVHGIERARAERDLLVLEMKSAGYGYDVISATLGMKKARVAQIVTGALATSGDTDDGE